MPRRFRTKFNARITADCLAGGYLRVEVRQGETPLYVNGERYLKTPGPVATQVERGREGWLVRIRASDYGETVKAGETGVLGLPAQ